MIIVISDVHLGYDQSDQNNFNNFIDSKLMQLNKNDHLVILGDLLDFWRKNCIDATVEYELGAGKTILKSTNNEGIIIKKLYDLQKKLRSIILLEIMIIPYSTSLKELTTLLSRFLSLYLEICICQ
jgi:UDP-2,3-diacylglucosamine pyrophosphatase LpxH